MYTFPWRLLAAPSQQTWLAGRAVAPGGLSVGGISQASVTSGGGIWRSNLMKIPVLNPDSIRCARAWSAMLDGGATQFILPCWDLGQAPRPLVGGQPALPGSPAPTTDYFAQDPSYGSALIQAVNVGVAALRATTIQIQISVGTSLLGGEHFSIQHASGAWRMYRVARVDSATGTTQTVEIRPPLREALTGGETAEFDVPRFQAMLDPSKADDFEVSLQMSKLGSINGYFMEAF